MEWQETINALGGRDVLGKDVISGTAFVERVEQGLPRNALAELKRFSHLSDSDFAAVIPRRTLKSIKRAPRCFLIQETEKDTRSDRNRTEESIP